MNREDTVTNAYLIMQLYSDQLHLNAVGITNSGNILYIRSNGIYPGYNISDSVTGVLKQTILVQSYSDMIKLYNQTVPFSDKILFITNSKSDLKIIQA